MIRGSDGLDYEDLAARLLGEPAKNRRNQILRSTHSRLFKEAFRETYDHYEEQGYPPLECHRAAFAQACISAAEHARARRWDGLGAVTLDTHAHYVGP